MSQSRTGFLQRSALLVGGCVAAVLLVEMFLQVGALVVRATGRDGPGDWRSANLRVLALGDSNTFGLYLEADESYPSQLQALWNRVESAPKIEVLNLGYPGTSSSYLRASFDELLETFDPDLVLVQVGVNDYWTAPLDAAAEGGASSSESGSALSALRRYSRVYKLVYMLRKSLEGSSELEIDFNRKAVFDGNEELNHTGFVRYGSREFRLSEATDGDPDSVVAPRPGALTDSTLAENLIEMLEDARKREALPVIVTYPSSGFMYGSANRVMRRVARASGTPLVDPAKEFEGRCSDEACREYLLEDRHANVEGYRVVAELVRNALVPLLGERGGPRD